VFTAPSCFALKAWIWVDVSAVMSSLLRFEIVVVDRDFIWLADKEVMMEVMEACPSG
jgi:hypothetical protein